MEGHERIHIGTSGWHYPHWRGPFYPQDLPDSEALAYYAARFETVEVNNTFYQLPDEQTFIGWREQAPERFFFAVKASQYITHMKKLKDPEEPVANFLSHAELLGDKLGPVLFQLPPRWRFNGERLRAFLQALPKSHRYAFEFRDPSWFNNETYEALAERGAAFCIYHLAGCESPKQVTADFIYVRLHGPGGAYQGRYTREELSGWVGAFSNWVRQSKEIYVYFDNDQKGYAPANAAELKAMVEN